MGLGSLQVQSGLGQKFQASLSLTGSDAGYLEAACYRARIENIEGGLLAPVTVAISDTSAGRQLQLISRRDVNEPTVKLVVDVSCEIQLQRSYTVLLDPPVFAPYQTLAPTKASQNSETKPSAKTVPETVKPSTVRTKPRIPETDTPAATARGVDATAVPEKKNRLERSKKISMPVRDSLKLSDDVTIAQSGLKVSNELGPSSQLDPAQLRAEQARLAAYLRDEPVPIVTAEKQPEKQPETPANQISEQVRATSQQRETEQLRKQNQQSQIALDELRENSVPRNWVLGLMAFVLLGISLIIGLIVYIVRLNKKIKSGWWEEKHHSPELAEPKKDIAAIVDNVQASYSATNSLYKVEDPGQKINSMPMSAKAAEAAPKSEPLTQNSVFKKNPYLPTLEDSNSSTFNFFATKTNSVKVEEISDVTQEAEFWMSVNDPQRAIEILEPQADIEIPDSPVPWLYLLDLYRIVADKEKYDGLRDRFIAYFNANIPEFEVDPGTLPTRQLEDFPHLIEKICAVWSSNGALPFLEALLVDDRDGKRMGFELPVYRDILLLISVAHELERTRVQSQAVSRQDAGLKIQESPASADDSLQFEVIEFDLDPPLKNEKDL